MAVPPTRPAAPPMAAPAPALPEREPRARPAAAPTAVPTSAPVARFWLAVPLGDVPPICCWAHCLHVASSAWNASKGFPGPGITATLGPVGMVAHPESITTTENSRTPRFQFMVRHL